MASTPQERFKEANLSDSIDYNYNRAKLAWYTIEPTLQDKNSTNNPLRANLTLLSDPRVRQVFTNELFPQKTTNITDVQLPTFDLSYYPKERGPYNFNYKDMDASGKFINPRDKWGGIMRALDQTDFETGIIEYVEFWAQDPFIKSNATKGTLVLNLGNVSEDILRDGRRFYENGMPTPTIPAGIDSSTWGRVPVNPIQVTNAFSNNPEDRKYQDVGLDGLGDDDERNKKAYVINKITNANVKQHFTNDPSADNYVWYRDAKYDASNVGILGRYKNFNNPQGNSALALAITEKSLDVIKVLVDTPSIDLERPNLAGETPVMMLAYNDMYDLLVYLVDKRDVEINKPGWTALHYAATNGHVRVASYLLDKHAYIDALSPNGTTPLMMAARGGHIHVVKLLLDRGADLSKRNGMKMTAIEFAEQNNQSEIATGLKSRWSKVYGKPYAN